MTPRQPATAGELRRSALVVAPLTAAALIAQQVASNAVRDALFLTWFRGHEPPVFHGSGGSPGDPRGGVIRPSPRQVRPGSRRSLHPRRQLSAVPGGMASARRESARGVGARLLSRECAWGDRDLGVLVVAQRALRPALGQGAHGASGRGGRLWWPGWGRRRGARDGPHVTGSAVHTARAVGRRVAWRVPCSSVAECRRGVHHRRCRRSAGADGPRSGACHFFETSPSWSRLPRRSPR